MKIDTTKYNAMVANASAKTVISSQMFKDFIGDVKDVVNSNSPEGLYAVDTGSTDAYAVTLSPAPLSYTTGMTVRFKANIANAGAATLNVNNLGPKTIKKNATFDLNDNDIVGGQVVQVVYDGTNFQMSASSGGGTGASASWLYQNAIINSNIEICNEGTAFNIVTGASRYTAEMFKSVNLGSGVDATVSQVNVTDLDGSTKALQMFHVGPPTAQGKLSHLYTMEAKDAYKFAGRKITISVKVKAVATMDRLTINARYKTTESAIANTDTLIGASPATAISSGAWTTVTLTVTLPARATLTATGVIGFEFIASKSTAEASGDGFNIGQVNANLGDAAASYQPRSFAEELQATLRYYEKSYDIGTNPAASAPTGAYFLIALSPNVIQGLRFKAVKRISSPTVSIYSPSGTPGKVWSNADIDISSGVTASQIGDSGCRYINAAGSGLTANTAISLHYTCDARL